MTKPPWRSLRTTKITIPNLTAFSIYVNLVLIGSNRPSKTVYAWIKSPQLSKKIAQTDFMKNLISQFNQGKFKMPLRLVLVVPFLLQTFAVVGVIEWLSIRNGKKAIDRLANQLMEKVVANVEQHVRGFADTPHLFLQINESGIKTGSLDLENFPVLQQNFWYQTQLSAAVPYIYYGKENGEFLGVRKELDGTTTLRIRTTSTAPNRNIYRLDATGKRKELIKTHEYDPRLRPWYQKAVAAGKPTWSSIYVFATPPSLGITPVTPIYNRAGELQGVLATDLTLGEISNFLRQLEVGKSGQVFVMERSGEIIASSADEQPVIETDGEEKRLMATESSELLIREAVGSLLAKFESFEDISISQQLAFEVDGKRQLLQVLPFRDDRGLDWLVVVVVPVADFMAEIDANTRLTIMLCLLALAVVSLFGTIAAGWIGRPIQELARAAWELADKSLLRGGTELGSDRDCPKVKPSRILELAILAESFNRMAEQLQLSFQQLEEHSRRQDEIVAERTRKLQQEISDRELLEQKLHSSETKMRALFEAMTDVVMVVDKGGSVEIVPTNMNCFFAEIDNVISLTIEQFFLDEKAELWLGQIRRALAAQQTINFDYSLMVENQEVWFSARISPMDEDSVIWVARDISDRKRSELALRLAQQKSEGLLLNILPQAIAEKLKQDPQAIAENFDDVTILFSDIVGFTPLSARMSPLELVQLLNKMFSAFDKLADKYSLEKIKTIGDAYMLAGGLPLPRDDHAEAVAEMALEMQAAVKRFQLNSVLAGESIKGLEQFQIRIGINTGPVVAGVIGIKKFIYDLWGDTVNVASRMESSGVPGGIQVSATTYDRLKDKFVLEERGAIAVKGKGQMITYWLLGKKS